MAPGTCSRSTTPARSTFWPWRAGRSTSPPAPWPPRPFRRPPRARSPDRPPIPRKGRTMTYTRHTPGFAAFEIPRRGLPVVAAGSATVVGVGAIGTAPADAEPRGRRDEIENPRFEHGLQGWRVAGDGAGVVELDEGKSALRCAPAEGASVTVSQEVEIRRPQWWTLRASV